MTYDLTCHTADRSDFKIIDGDVQSDFDGEFKEYFNAANRASSGTVRVKAMRR